MEKADEEAYPVTEKKIDQAMDDKSIKQESLTDPKHFQIDDGGMSFHDNFCRTMWATLSSAIANFLILCCSPCVCCYRKSVRRKYSFDDAEPKSMPSKDLEIEAQIEVEHAPEIIKARPSFTLFRPRISFAFHHSDDEDDTKTEMSDSQSKSPSGQLLRPPARKSSAIYHSRLLKLFEGVEPETDDEESSSLMISLPYHPHYSQSPHPNPEDL